MKHNRSAARIVACALLVVAYIALTAACGPEQTPQTIASTDIPIPPTDTPIPPTAAPTSTATSTPTDTATPVPPTDTPTSVPPSDTPTNTPLPPTCTPTPIPPTETFTPTPKPTKTPTARPRKTATPTPQTFAAPVLVSPVPEFVCYGPNLRRNIRGTFCPFSWSWEGTLPPNHYFQVQWIGGPANEHRAINPPTKDWSYTYTYPSDTYSALPDLVRDWCSSGHKCHLQWTVVLVEWDGTDPSRIGRILSEAEPRWFYY